MSYEADEIEASATFQVFEMEVDTSEEGGNNSGEGVDTFGKRSERVERENEGQN